MAADTKGKSVKFNLDKEDDQELFQYASSMPNFQEFVKGKLREEMQLRGLSPIPIQAGPDGVIRIILQ